MTPTRRARRTRTGIGRVAQTFRSTGLQTLLLHTTLWGNGYQMATVAQIYALLQISDSQFQLAILGGATSIGTVGTALIGGTLADRFSRKSLLMFGSTFTATTFIVLGILLVTGHAQPWHLQIGAFVQGSSLALDWTARFAIIPNMVERRILVRSLSFDLATFNLTRVIAPLIWGAIVAVFDYTLPYFVIVALLVLNIVVISRFRPTPDATAHSHGALMSEVSQIPRILLSDPRVFGIMTFTAVTALALGGFTYLLTPFGQNVVSANATGVSALFSAVGIGSFIGSLSIGVLGAPKQIGCVMIAAVFAMATATVVFATSGVLFFAVALACMFALSHSTHVGLGYIILMLSTSDNTRGRIAGLYELAWSGFPIGGLVFPAIAGITTERTSLLVIPVMLVCATILSAIFNPTLRNFRLSRK